MTRKTRALPRHAWPGSDVLAWEAAFRDGDVFDGRGAGHHLADGSRFTILMGYRAWLGHLQEIEPAALELALEVRVTPERVHRYVEAMQARGLASSTVWNAVKHLYDALRVMAPEHDWSWLKQLKARLEAAVEPRRKAHRMVDAAALLDLGLGLMDEAEEALRASSSRQEVLQLATQFRTGLIIALLASRPIRRRTLAGLRIDSHLQRHGASWTIVLEAPDTKTGRPEEWLIPELLAPYLERYLGKIRPLFRGSNNHSWLWTSNRGGQLSSEQIYMSVKRVTEEVFGTSVNLHLFRDVAATTVARAAPDKIGIATHLLGHVRLETAEAHYNRAGSLEACRRNQSHLALLKQRLEATYRRDRGEDR